ncbi:SDR family oxidoreductase [soil metagenome]
MNSREQSNHTGKYTLITGGTQGIGYELARVFAENGHNLILVARHEVELFNTATELQEQYGVQVITIPTDLFVFENAFKLYEEVKGKGLEVNILINDAGQGQYGKFIDNDIYRYLDIIQLNIASLTVLTHLFLKDMVASGTGKILNLSSIAGTVPGPYQAIYHATKAFVQSFTIAVRDEVRDSGVTLTALLPGATDTDFFNKAEMNDSKVVQEGNMYDPADVAKDGYDALMAGKDMVISGFKNKVQVTMSNLMSDSRNAATMREQQKPAHGDE